MKRFIKLIFVFSMVFNAAPALAWGNCDYSKKAQSTSESSMPEKVEDTAPSSKDKKN